MVLKILTHASIFSDEKLERLVPLVRLYGGDEESFEEACSLVNIDSNFSDEESLGRGTTSEEERTLLAVTQGRTRSSLEKRMVARYNHFEGSRTVARWRRERRNTPDWNWIFWG
ncbi:HlyC/CorC family transporter [Sesbania bispinosa]|nr:HlyC/CorC family transporter [Sesbania bispinosa]